MSTLDRIATIIKDVTQNENATISATSTAADIEGWDSLSHIYIIAEVEDAFGIRMTAQEGSAIKNVGDLIHLVEAKAT